MKQTYEILSERHQGRKIKSIENKHSTIANLAHVVRWEDSGNAPGACNCVFLLNSEHSHIQNIRKLFYLHLCKL